MIAPAKTGKERSSRIAVIRIDQTNKGILSIEILVLCILRMVEIKLIAPRIEDIPAIWREKIVKSTEGPLWNEIDARGGYTVQPVPDPSLIKLLKINREMEGGKSQNLMLFKRG